MSDQSPGATVADALTGMMSGAPIATLPVPGVAQPAAAPAPVATPPAAAAPSVPAEAPAPPAKAPYLNPWASRPAAPAKAAAASPAPAVDPAPSPASAPVADPRVDALMAVLGETVTQDLASVPANVAATVKAIAGDDPVAQRKALNALRANGLATAAPAPLPVPASTAQPHAPVNAPATPADTDAAHLAKWEQMSKVAPVMASAYRSQHSASINRALAARTSPN